MYFVNLNLHACMHLKSFGDICAHGGCSRDTKILNVECLDVEFPGHQELPAYLKIQVSYIEFAIFVVTNTVGANVTCVIVRSSFEMYPVVIENTTIYNLILNHYAHLIYTT